MDVAYLKFYIDRLYFYFSQSDFESRREFQSYLVLDFKIYLWAEVSGDYIPTKWTFHLKHKLLFEASTTENMTTLQTAWLRHYPKTDGALGFEILVYTFSHQKYFRLN